MSAAPGQADRAIAAAIGLATFALLMSTMGIGFTRDESFYFHAARDYAPWFKALFGGLGDGGWRDALGRVAVDRAWSYNHEHPALMKSLFALSGWLFHEMLGWTSASSAMRLPGAAASAWLVAMVYAFVRRATGRAEGIVAAGALLLQPRFFFHAHMAAFDAPIAAAWFATVYAYWRSLEAPRWAWAAGAAWGLALATKLNAFFIPIVLGAHWLWRTRSAWGFDRAARSFAVPPIPRALIAMLAIGPLIFLAHWPYIWFDTFERIRWYMDFHLRHVHYFVWYFGEPLIHPPFPITFPWVMTLVTTPVGVLAAAAFGVPAWRKRAPPGSGSLIALNVIAPIALIALPSTPVFGGTKHWLPAMPFIAALAGVGAVWAARSFARALGPGESAIGLRVAPWVAGALVLAPAAAELARNHPYGTSYYNEAIGGVRGAARSGMMRQYWGYASRDALPWLNENAPKDAAIFLHNMTGGAWDEYTREGLVREDLRPTGIGGSDYALYHHQAAFTFIRDQIWESYGVRAPVWVLDLDGVPLVSVYERPRARKKREAARRASGNR